ncbi:MAG: hypothetical protein IT381_25360 [Deltaproteobacteria bacterium]|nr:hypothetical protein [Deltaproteobacteria bacterium]
MITSSRLKELRTESVQASISIAKSILEQGIDPFVTKEQERAAVADRKGFVLQVKICGDEKAFYVSGEGGQNKVEVPRANDRINDALGRALQTELESALQAAGFDVINVEMRVMENLQHRPEAINLRISACF